ncbi:hypothetical protein F5Y17DRAFT_443086 [Xylariaceae sp. FL0594]|nr:hypothetical protein F5Y17DRAFT_443086 [Xylariaceae sp. FL0594]
MEPLAFWTAVCNEVPWTRNEHRIDGETVQALALLAISARFFCTNDANDWEEIEVLSPEAAKDMRTDTVLTRAVDAFKDGIYKKHPVGSDTRQKYVPRYTQQSHNMGSQEATDDMWARICRGEYKVSDFNLGAAEYWDSVEFSDHEQDGEVDMTDAPEGDADYYYDEEDYIEGE